MKLVAVAMLCACSGGAKRVSDSRPAPGGAPVIVIEEDELLTPGGDQLNVRTYVGKPKLDKSSIKHKVRMRFAQIQQCYEKRLLDEPNLKGTTLVVMSVDAKGVVQDAKGSGFDDKVDGCVAAEMKQIVFDPPDQPTTVHYPFSFRPAGS